MGPPALVYDHKDRPRIIFPRPLAAKYSRSPAPPCDRPALRASRETAARPAEASSRAGVSCYTGGMDPSTRLPTSVILDTLARDAPSGEVTLGWIIGSLRERSFGIVLLLIGLVGLLPGVSPFAGALLAVPAIQMLLGRDEPVLPERIANRRFSTQRLGRLIARVTPALRRIERAVRPRWSTPLETRKRVVGGITLLLGATLLVPVPFSHLLPIAAIMLLAFAFLEEDGLILAIAVAVALLSLAVSAAALWGAIEVGLLI